jgi:hypothetical protein
MADNILKDQYGKLLGSISVDSRGIQTLRSHLGVILGTFDPKTNVTKNYIGQIIGTGNLLSMLIVK